MRRAAADFKQKVPPAMPLKELFVGRADDLMRVFLKTERLTLREFTEDDAELLFELDSDPEVMRYIGPYRLADVAAYRQHIAARLPLYARTPYVGVWAALDRGGQFLGWLFLRPGLDYRFAAKAGFREGDLELGYRFRRAAWGNGYATEGSRALVRYGFTTARAERVVGCALADNLASVHVLEKVGLREIGRTAIPEFESPLVVFALDAADYQSG